MPKIRVVRHEVTQPLDPSYRLIALTQGQNAIVDAEDFEWLSEWNWYARWCKNTRSFYAGRGGNIQMHRVILDCRRNEDADHENHDTLDNRKKNLRKCNDMQNSRNARKRKDSTSGFKGVSYRKDSGKWRARVGLAFKRIHLGNFSSAKQAARAYDEAAKKYFGEFAHLNFPELTPR